jgi:hypothetical protein
LAVFQLNGVAPRQHRQQAEQPGNSLHNPYLSNLTAMIPIL